MRATSVAGALLVVACLTHAGAAHAQSSGGVAQSLFEEGVRLMREKKYDQACPKLAESHKLEPAGGTVFNLALCLEEQGKLASAYVAYDEALARAKKDGNTKRAQIVEGRIAALRPKLSRVTIKVAAPAGGAPKPEVRFDGTPLGEQAWGIPFYADVGVHTIRAEAPGYKPFQGDLRVDSAGKQFEIEVPALEAEPAPVATAPEGNAAPPKQEPKPPSEPPPAASTGRGPLPWILVGSGVALIGAGAVTGALAFSNHSDSDAECPNGRCSAAGVDAENRANTFAWVSDVTIPLGVIAAAAGVYLFIKKPSSTTAGTRIAPTAGGLVVFGGF